MLEVMFDLPQREDVVEVVIDEAVVKGLRRPLLKKAPKSGETKADAA
jgi:ATP-dependent Clp protease ATP-binding subunit ClpX